jgi:Trehalase
MPDKKPDKPVDSTADQALDNQDIDLVDRAKSILQLNDRGSFTVPSGDLYPHQWLWDSCFIAIGQAHYDVDRAKAEILSMFRGQWSNGMVPSIILRPRKSDDGPAFDRHEQIWRSWLNPNAPDDVSTSGITQPPMLAEAITRIGNQLSKTERRVWYKQVYGGLVKYHEWLYAERDPHNEGLVLLIHPWEIGLDNTPPWMQELNEHLLPWWIRVLSTFKLEKVIGWFRSDSKFVFKNERLTNIEALALFDAQRRLRRKHYEFDKLIDHALFAVEDLSFNCIFIRANHLLQDIAKVIDKPLPDELIAKMEKTDKQLNSLWDEYAQEYFSRDFVSHRLLKQSSIAAFMPLYSGAISKDKASRIVASLENGHRFGSAYPIPSVPLDSPWFEANRYWQGPTWLNTNWMVIDGLRRYGFKDHAEALKESTLEMVKDAGFHEYFNAIDGHGLGVDNFSWTAALTIDLLKSSKPKD